MLLNFGNRRVVESKNEHQPVHWKCSSIAPNAVVYVGVSDILFVALVKFPQPCT
jgi:hypothetical protein